MRASSSGIVSGKFYRKRNADGEKWENRPKGRKLFFRWYGMFFFLFPWIVRRCLVK